MAAVWRFLRGVTHRFLALRVWPLPRSMATFGLACCFRFRPGVFPRVATGELSGISGWLNCFLELFGGARLMLGTFFKGLPPSAVGWVRAALNNLID